LPTLRSSQANDPDNIFKISLDVLEETRTLRVIGKNVDDLNLETIFGLLQQAADPNNPLNPLFSVVEKGFGAIVLKTSISRAIESK
jgi:hypothetical protein